MVVEDNRDQSSQQIGIAIQEDNEEEDIQTLRLTYCKGLSVNDLRERTQTRILRRAKFEATPRRLGGR